ncbi:MAG: enoyl-CoA hydratase-related protein [Bacteroidetes bacterium]|jgi:methylglutaconyl-CoA hydratase|nr:enoyl-CoA hydratase-related protein [Bacteroidota bacterium]
MEYTRLKYEIRGRSAIITLSRPEKHNALDDLMVAELGQAFTHASRDGTAKVVILRAEGESFCAGADLAYLKKLSEYDFNQNQRDSQQLMKLFLQIYTLRKPVVGLVQGPALAGGCGLATVCDIVLAARETATFGYTEVHIGFVPAIVMAFLLRRVGEGRARELTLRGHTISAEEAYQMGLVNRLVPAMQLDEEGERLAQELADRNSGSSMGLVKELLGRIHGLSTADALDYASNLNALTRMTEECKKGIAAFLNKEPLRW